MLIRRLTTAAVVLVCVAALGGCSGGGRLTKSEFINRADAICRDANKHIAAIKPPDLADPAETPRVLRQLVTIQRHELGQLRKLRGPRADLPGIRDWLKQVERALDQASMAVAALEQGDRDGVNAANARGNTLQAAADRAAREYGVDRCARAAPPGTAATSP
jgi:hypothetical protein